MIIFRHGLLNFVAEIAFCGDEESRHVGLVLYHRGYPFFFQVLERLSVVDGVAKNEGVGLHEGKGEEFPRVVAT